MGAGVPRDQSVSAFPSAQFLKSSLATGNDRAGTRQVRPKPLAELKQFLLTSCGKTRECSEFSVLSKGDRYKLGNFLKTSCVI